MLAPPRRDRRRAQPTRRSHRPAVSACPVRLRPVDAPTSAELKVEMRVSLSDVQRRLTSGSVYHLAG